MTFLFNPAVERIAAPPISEAQGWLRDSTSNLPVIDLSQAVPSYPPAPELRAEIARVAALAGTETYTDVLGLPELRQATARALSRTYAANVDAADVAVTAGCNQAFCVSLMALAGPGTNVILPSPWYFNHRMWLDALGIETRALPGLSHTAAHPDPDAAAALIDGNTRAIVLCTPNNPTGAVYPPGVLDAFHDLCRDRGIALVVDETYKDFLPEGTRPHGLFARPGWRDTFVHLHSFSKVFAITGYRVGSLAAGPKLLAQAEKLMDCVAICAPRISQLAAVFALANLGAWSRANSRTMADREAALRQAMRARPGGFELESAGVFFAYVRHPFAQPAKDVAIGLAHERRLLCLPGSMFGPGQERHLRIAFANVEAALMPEAAARLARLG